MKNGPIERVLPGLTLKGLKGVNVVVEAIPGLERFDPTQQTRQQIQTDTESRLRQNSIKVLTEQEWLKSLESSEDCSLLYINLDVRVPEEIPLFTYNILVELKQEVLLVRDMTKVCLAATWDRGWSGLTGRSPVKKDILENVKDLVDIFINDYLAVNPKK
jgi:hypothetical protein